VLLGGEKMAKSTGNFVVLRELLIRHEPIAVRFYLLSSHYRSVMDFTWEGLEAAKQGYMRLLNAYRETRRQLAEAPAGRHTGLERAIDELESRFAAALDDDLNTAQALAALFEFVTELNRALPDKPGRDTLARAEEVFGKLGEGVLGLFPKRVLEASLSGPLLDGLVKLLLEIREEARRERNFALSDRIRARLTELGLTVEDTREGPKWRVGV
jgi:cysteinyl-tRNA synthetase